MVPVEAPCREPYPPEGLMLHQCESIPVIPPVWKRCGITGSDFWDRSPEAFLRAAGERVLATADVAARKLVCNRWERRPYERNDPRVPNGMRACANRLLLPQLPSIEVWIEEAEHLRFIYVEWRGQRAYFGHWNV